MFIALIANRVADDRVRPVHAPSEARTPGDGEQLVFLRVIEVVDVEPGLVLAKRRGRQLAFAVSLERTEVMLEPGHQRHVAERTHRRQRVEDVAHHGAVDPDVVRLGFLPQPCADEGVGGAQPLQRGAKRCRVEQIRLYRQHAVNVVGRPPRQPIHLPAPRAQMAGKVVAHDAAGSHHKRQACHALLELFTRPLEK